MTPHQNKLLDDAWAVYVEKLKSVPKAERFDRVSVHEAIPEIGQAFEAYVLLSKLFKLNNYNEQ